MSGDFKFNHLLRVDGKFSGTLNSKGSVIIGTSGQLYTDVIGLDAIMVEGKVVGNIESVSVILRGTGSIFGNISCKSFFADAGCTIVGTVNIHKESPLIIDSDLNVKKKISRINLQANF